MTTYSFTVCVDPLALADYEDICYLQVFIAYRLTLSHGSQPDYTDISASNALIFSLMNITSLSGVSGNFL